MRLRSLSVPVVALLLLGASRLIGQTLNITPNPLNMAAQANQPASATLTFTSSGAAISFSVLPSVSWLHASIGNSQTTTPAVVTISADGMAAQAQPYLGSLLISSSSGFVNVPVNLSVSAIGVNPSSLSFPYVAGSASGPPAQTVALNVPSGVNFRLDVATATGGSWLQAGLTGNPPASVSAQINTAVAQTLSPGTYSGTLTLTPTSGANMSPASVQVTLVVTATPIVTITPSSLTYNIQSGGSNNVTTQSLVLTGANQDVTFVFTGDSWITTNLPNGILRANESRGVQVTVNPPASCTPATSPCNGTLTFNTAGPPQNIPIRVNLSASPLLNLDTTPLSFTYAIGGAVPASRTVATSSTSTPLTYTVAATTATGGSWLLATAQGAATTPNPVTVSIDPSRLGPGTYQGTVTVTGAGGSAQSVPVTLKVTNDPQLVTSASFLAFPYQIGQALPTPQNLRVTTNNGLPLNYVASTTTPWLVLVGQTSGTTDGTFTVSVNPAGVSAGTNLGQINFAVTNPATGTALPNVSVPVTLYVSASALLVVTPAQPVVFTVQAGTGTPSLPQNFTLSSTSGTDQLTLTVSQPQTASGGNWLFLSGQPSSTPGTIGLVAAPLASLAAGVYTGSVTVTATGPGGAAVLDSPFTIPVVLQVTTGAIAAAPASLSFTQSTGGASPASQTINVTAAAGSLNFFASAFDGGLGWLAVTNTSTATPGTVSVSADGSRLTAGTYTGRVVIASNFASNSPVVIPVTFTVTAGTIAASPASLTFNQLAGGPAPSAQTINVTGTPSALAFTVTTSTDNNGTWLKTPTVSSSTTPATVTVSVDGSNLSPGTYTGKVTITSTGSSGSPITIAVSLVITASQTLSVSPSTIDLTYVIGTPVPQGRLVQVSTTAGTSVFTAQPSPGINWLQAVPGSGNIPGSFSIVLNTSALTTAGSLVGTITVSSPSAVVPVRVTVNLTVLAIPTPRVIAVANAASYASGAISPGENIVIGGTGIGPSEVTKGRLTTNGQAVDTIAGNTRVLFDNIPAPVIYVSATQSSVMVPYEVQGRAQVQIRVEYQGIMGDPFAVTVAGAAPGIYTINQQGNGPGAILNQDGVTVNTATTPEKRGNVVVVYITGEGQTSPLSQTGALATTLKTPLLQVTATVGGFAAKVLYAGASPGIVSGVAQVNVEIPLDAPTGPAVPITIALGSALAQGGVTVAVAPQ